MNEVFSNDKKTKLSKPLVRVYKRPLRKKITEHLTEKTLFVENNLKTSRWKNDSKVIEIVTLAKQGHKFFEKSFVRFDFSGASMPKAKMPSCDFSEAIFEGAVLREGNFNHANFQGADLRSADFSYADLSFADLTGANLVGTNLEGAILTGAKMDQVIFSEDTDFGGVLADAKIQKNIDKIMSLQEAAEKGEIDLRSLGIVDLRKLDFRTLNLKGVYLKDKNLKGKLTGVNLSGAIINESDILGADVNMIHYWVRNMNEYNEIMDTKKILQKKAEEQENILLQLYENEEIMKNELLDVATSEQDYIKPEYDTNLPPKHEQDINKTTQILDSDDQTKKRGLQENEKPLKSLYKGKNKTRLKPIRGKLIS